MASIGGCGYSTEEMSRGDDLAPQGPAGASRGQRDPFTVNNLWKI